MVTLVVVESPAKCAKIQGFLGAGYIVKASMGHIRALDETLDAVGIDKGWDPTYKELSTKKSTIADLRKAAKGADVILASDDDREGEGIAWHVCFILKLNPATTRRIVFHEITKPAILAAVANPRLLDMNKVNAQQARSMLDLLVGFTMSRVLWNRVAPKLSAGRCQTPALRLVAERDAEVENHTSSAFWRLEGTFKHPAVQMPLLAAAAEDIKTEPAAVSALKAVHEKTASQVITVKTTISSSAPPKPLITSTLQQEASSNHGLNPKTTMQAAQKLYEAGHITYMRTDNPMLSVEAATAIRQLVVKTYGQEYVGSVGQHQIQEAGKESVAEVKEKKKKKDASIPAMQAAHEAIRPTHPETEPAIEDSIQKTVYRLIWKRAVQSQMATSTTDVRKASLVIEADPSRVWNVEQTKSQFQGWRIVEKEDSAKTASELALWNAWTAHLVKGAVLQWTSVNANEHFTKPKGRFTEASLIAELEKRGIGRPSTFASLVGTILDREYVEKTNMEGRTQDSRHLSIFPQQWPPATRKEAHKVGAEKNKIRSTPLGRSVTTFLTAEYSDLFDYEFTARMERDLDEIATGVKPWKALLQTTWDTYKERYTAAIAGGSTAFKSSRERALSTDMKVILSKKGPLFVKESATPGGKTTFASLPTGVTFESAKESDAIQAFAAANEGDLIGFHEEKEIRKKKGPYGLYAQWNGTRVPLKGEETVEQIIEKLVGKATANKETQYSRILGEFTIKKGQYGLYFYKNTLKRVSFIKFPPAADPEKVTIKDLQGLYRDGLEKKKKIPFKKED